MYMGNKHYNYMKIHVEGNAVVSGSPSTFLPGRSKVYMELLHIRMENLRTRLHVEGKSSRKSRQFLETLVLPKIGFEPKTTRFLIHYYYSLPTELQRQLSKLGKIQCVRHNAMQPHE